MANPKNSQRFRVNGCQNRRQGMENPSQCQSSQNSCQLYREYSRPHLFPMPGFHWIWRRRKRGRRRRRTGNGSLLSHQEFQDGNFGKSSTQGAASVLLARLSRWMPRFQPQIPPGSQENAGTPPRPGALANAILGLFRTPLQGLECPDGRNSGIPGRAVPSSLSQFLCHFPNSSPSSVLAGNGNGEAGSSTHPNIP